MDRIDDGVKSKQLFKYRFWRLADHLFGGQIPCEKFANLKAKIGSVALLYRYKLFKFECLNKKGHLFLKIT